jgi:hypothetical protein
MDGTGSLGRLLIAAGLALVALGALLFLAHGLGLGRLPGDVVIRRERFTLYLPFATCVLLSLLLSGIVWLVKVLRR